MHIPDQESRGHILPTGTYIKIGLLLYVLTIITVAASFMPAESLLIRVTIAMAIAAIKAFFVIWYFMHMKFEDTATRLFALGIPIFLFALLVIMTAIDIFARVHVNPTF